MTSTLKGLFQESLRTVKGIVPQAAQEATRRPLSNFFIPVVSGSFLFLRVRCLENETSCQPSNKSLDSRHFKTGIKHRVNTASELMFFNNIKHKLQVKANISTASSSMNHRII